ncbi:MAG: DUF488 domain-containing protein [Sedimentisphaerales bacterium]|nr:DUF488 domain-containing protein [Sedimentisphaerales bacterium]
MKELFTIGHSNHTLERFLELLSSQNISAIADVRSNPYSQYSPQFNKDLLEQRLRYANIEYIFLGRELGARSPEDSCYIEDQAKYELIALLPAFRAGLDRVFEEINHYRLALMCSEDDPLMCHRTILICRELRKTRHDLKITHILGNGAAESHEQAEKRLVRLHKLEPELFGELTTEPGLIERAYDLQAEKIAFKKEPAQA